MRTDDPRHPSEAIEALKNVARSISGTATILQRTQYRWTGEQLQQFDRLCEWSKEIFDRISELEKLVPRHPSERQTLDALIAKLRARLRKVFDDPNERFDNTCAEALAMVDELAAARPLTAQICPSCDGKGWLTPDDAERAVQHHGELFHAGREHYKQHGAAPAPTVAPIPLGAEHELAVKEWAADDRLWTTQETVEVNLRTFARVILKGTARIMPVRKRPAFYFEDDSQADDSPSAHESSSDLSSTRARPPREEQTKPRVVCLCGSTRFIDQFATATWELERQGFIVLGCTLLPMWFCGVASHFGEATGTKEQCDEHHKRKIDLADDVLVLNIGGYIGESTRSEIGYATALGKPVHYVTDDPNLLAKILPPADLAVDAHLDYLINRRAAPSSAGTVPSSQKVDE